MFRKLHLQLTILCVAATGAVMAVLTGLCLFFAVKDIRRTGYTAFLTEVNATVSHLQEQDYISHQWLSSFQESGRFLLYLYDGENPIIYQQYHASPEGMRLAGQAADAARDRCGIDLFAASGQKLTSHAEFRFRAPDREDYYVSAGIIPKNGGQLGFLLLYPLRAQHRQLWRLRMTVLFGDLCALLLLAVFFRYLTGKMIGPLSEAQKKQTRFIASASHELRSPLTVLRSGLESLSKTDDLAKQKHFLRLMSDESCRMQRLIDDMLLLANADSDSLPVLPADCQPDGLLLNIYEKYEPLAAEKQIRLLISLPEELLPDCRCDAARMQQVFSVLMDNALSYTPAGGRIELALTYTGSSFRFFVSDSGCGIPDSEKKRIFERFYRSDPSHTEREHFGLGLCIAREIVKKHAGTIRVTDRPGGGSCFITELPAPSRTRG